MTQAGQKGYLQGFPSRSKCFWSLHRHKDSIQSPQYKVQSKQVGRQSNTADKVQGAHALNLVLTAAFLEMTESLINFLAHEVLYLRQQNTTIHIQQETIPPLWHGPPNQLQQPILTPTFLNMQCMHVAKPGHIWHIISNSAENSF